VELEEKHKIFQTVDFFPRIIEMENIMNKNYVSLSEIEAKPLARAKTGFDELDFIYGVSKFPDRTMWGMPRGTISLWSGTSGIGKSRMAIEVAKNIVKSDPSFKVLYFQTEADLEDFAGWVKDSSQYKNFYCSGENKIDKMIDIIYEVKPHIVFIDSVNEIDEFINGTKQEARRLINGEGDKVGLKKICKDLGDCHIILLGQLNQDMSIKGGTSLPHLVDIALNLQSYDKECRSTFTVTVGVKHRYGRRDNSIYGIWQHSDDGVWSASSNRMYDSLWCETHGLKTGDRQAEIRALMTEDIEPGTLNSDYVTPKKGFLSKCISNFWR